MDNILRIRTLAERFMAGETTISEEQELAESFRTADLPPDLQPLRELLLGLQAVRLPASKENSVHKGKRHWWTAIAATAAVLIIAGGLLWQSGQNECVAYIYGKRCTDRATVMHELHQNISEMTYQEDTDVERQLHEMFGIN